MAESFLDGKVTLHRGDCLDVLAELEESSVDSVVCDPPYHLTSIVKRFAKANIEREHYAREHAGGAYQKLSKGFMGKQWDGGDVAFKPETWALVLRVLKPGGHLLAFSGTRTYHRMACAIEDAGFEIRDQIGWVYGSGFPKSHDVSKGIDRMAGECRQSDYVPNHLNGIYGKGMGGGVTTKPSEPISESAIRWQGWGTALKPAWEPIVLARKPLSESSIAANVLKHGTGGINVDGCRIGTGESLARPYGGDNEVYGKFSMSRGTITGENLTGRWPANLIHDGSEEVLAGFPDVGKSPPVGSMGGGSNRHSIYGDFAGERHENGFGDSGSAARFFYTAKADVDDRLGSKHPTVKPLDLMQYLCRLITPKGGLVLDPFAGTGTTGEAAWREGFRAVLIEREPEYQADVAKRMGLCLSGPDARRAASTEQEPHETLPLFRIEVAE